MHSEPCHRMGLYQIEIEIIKIRFLSFLPFILLFIKTKTGIMDIKVVMKVMQSVFVFILHSVLYRYFNVCE